MKSPSAPASSCDLRIPKLTTLLKFSSDPMLRPFSHVTRIYPYSHARRLVRIPAFSHKPQIVKRFPTLKAVDEARFRLRSRLKTSN